MLNNKLPLLVTLSATLALASCGGKAPRPDKEVVKACQEMLKQQSEGKATKEINLTTFVDEYVQKFEQENGPINVNEERNYSKEKSGKDENIGVVQQGLSVLKAKLWPRGSMVNVCWENADPESKEALRVKEAIDRTWNALFSSPDVKGDQGVLFVGWGKCKDSDTGIRIKVTENGPHTKDLGTGLTYLKPGMELNFNFSSWSTGCSSPESERLTCIDWIAVHEFGHVLGMGHEQNRSDTPDPDCAAQRQGTSGDTNLGAWDLYSVMNYCGPEWNASGKLSALDKFGIRYLYAPTIGVEFCQDLVDTIAEQEAHYHDTTISQKVRDLFNELFKD